MGATKGVSPQAPLGQARLSGVPLLCTYTRSPLATALLSFSLLVLGFATVRPCSNLLTVDPAFFLPASSPANESAVKTGIPINYRNHCDTLQVQHDSAQVMVSPYEALAVNMSGSMRDGRGDFGAVSPGINAQRRCMIVTVSMETDETTLTLGHPMQNDNLSPCNL